MIIQGDNLHALKALMPRYAGRVKCIYIDPPYNTGNEKWVYNDKVNSQLMQVWLKDNSVVDGEDLERHDKWLCMMWPRLHLLRELLAEDGAIFVSIDDNEVHYFRAIMDEVFGEDNFRNILTIRRGQKNVQAQFEYVDRLNIGQEYIIFYSKSSKTRFNHMTSKTSDKSIGKWNNHWRGTDRPNMRYCLFGKTPQTGQWRWNESKSAEAVDNYKRLLDELGPDPKQSEIDEWWFCQQPAKVNLLRLSATGKPEHYVPPSDRKILSSLWTDMTVNESQSLMNNLGTKFDNPKRVNLIRRIIEYMTINDNEAIILDSFAGSGTTAHAVLALNKEDGGNRKFVLIECEDYADNITAERVRRVIKGVPKATDDTLRKGLGGSFTYCKLGEPFDVETMLTGEVLPDFSSLAAWLLHTASGVSAGSTSLSQKNKDGLFHRGDGVNYYLLYKPNVDWLNSDGAMFNGKHAKRIETVNKKHKRTAVVFAPGKYITQRDLTAMGITFCQLPYEIHRPR